MNDHSDGNAEYKANRTGDASANLYANTGIHIGDFINISAVRLVEFGHIGIPNHLEPQWDEFPHGPEFLDCEFADGCDRLFSLKKLVYPADLFLDIVLLNSGDYPVVLSRVGVQIEAVQELVYIYGYPEAVKMRPAADEYLISIPDIRGNYDVGLMDHMSPDPVGVRLEHTLSDPVYLPAGAPYRYTLRLGDYQQNMPNHAQIRLTAAVGDQLEFSSKLHIFTR